MNADITEWLTEMAGHLTNPECIDPECADCAAGRTLIAAADEITQLRAAGDALADSIDLTDFAKAAQAWQEARRER